LKGDPYCSLRVYVEMTYSIATRCSLTGCPVGPPLNAHRSRDRTGSVRQLLNGLLGELRWGGLQPAADFSPPVAGFTSVRRRVGGSPSQTELVSMPTGVAPQCRLAALRTRRGPLYSHSMAGPTQGESTRRTRTKSRLTDLLAIHWRAGRVGSSARTAHRSCGNALCAFQFRKAPDRFPGLLPSNPEIVKALQVEPELGAGPEEMCQAQCGIACDGALPV